MLTRLISLITPSSLRIKRHAQAVIACALLFLVPAAKAADFKIDFAMSGFSPVGAGMGPAPYSSAYGTVVFSAASATSDWDALKGFNLVIGNATYLSSDVEFANYWDYTNVGGLNGGENFLNPGTNDFAFSVQHDGSAWLTYSSVNANGFWRTTSQVTITQLPPPISGGPTLPVPEPGSVVMIFAGLSLLGMAFHRRRNIR